MFEGKLTLDDILNHDRSLISELLDAKTRFMDDRATYQEKELRKLDQQNKPRSEQYTMTDGKPRF